MSKHAFKFPQWLQSILSEYMDEPDLTPTLMKDDNLFATMYNLKWKSLHLDINTLTIIAICKDNSQLLVEHNLDEDAFKQLWFKIKIKMGMDPLGPGSGLDNATLKDMKIGSIVLPCTFECEHNDMKLNLSVTRQ